MNSSTANIDNLSRAVLRTAENEAQKILSEAQDKANEIRRIAQQEREDSYHQVIAKALKEANFIRNKNRAAVEAEVQMDWLMQREKLINQVFEESLGSLQQVVDAENYQEIAENLVREAVFQLNDPEVRIRLDAKADQLIKDSLIKQIAEEQGVTIERGNVLQDQFGVIALTADGHRQFDNTLQARLDRKKNQLRMAVYHILMGES